VRLLTQLSLAIVTGFVMIGCPNATSQKIKAPAPTNEIKREKIKITGGYTEMDGEITIPGNLAPGERRPGILLVASSGPTDLDETMPAELTATGQVEKPFAQLSDALTRAGFIVLRYNKRGVEKAVLDSKDFNANPKNYLNLPAYQSINRIELLIDAKHAMATLRADARVAGVSVIGHSEGAMIAPIMATADPVVRSIILIGSPARNLKDILYYQEVELQQQLVFSMVDKNKDGSITKDEISAELEPNLPMAEIDTNKDSKISSDELKVALDVQYQKMLSAIEQGEATELYHGIPKGWYRSWMKAESNDSIVGRLRDMPLLVIHGEDDAQVPVSEAQTLQATLKKSGKTMYQVKTYPNLGHGLSPRRDGKPTLGPIDEAAIADITKWAKSTLFLP
jgi:pimeloyl-ACP methyl ester carboxylesterase